MYDNDLYPNYGDVNGNPAPAGYPNPSGAPAPVGYRDPAGNFYPSPQQYAAYLAQCQIASQTSQNVLTYYDRVRTNTNVSYNDPAVYAEKEKLAVENERYRCREQYRKQNETAFAKLEVSYRQCLMTPAKTGEMIKVADFNFLSAQKVKQPDGNIRYILNLTTKPDEPLELTQKEYFNDKLLLAALSEHSGKTILTCRTIRNTADIFRQAISVFIKKTELPFQGGWTVIDGNPRFLEYANGSTHTEQGSLELPHAISTENRTPEVKACAAERLTSHFLRIKNAAARSVLFLIFHIALLYSLLRDLGYQVPGGLYLSVPDARVRAYAQDILTCFHDPVVSLDAAPGLFTRNLALWKDEALLLDDSRLTSNSAKNCETLRAVVATGSLVDEKGTARLLNSVPVVLSAQASDLGSFSHLVNLDLNDSDIEWPSFITEGVQANIDPHGYALDFLASVESSIGVLRHDLESGRHWALAEGGSELTAPAMDFLGLFHGISHFLKRIYGSIGLAEVLDKVLPPEFFLEVPACLSEMAAKGSGGTDIADEFLYIVREEIKNLKGHQLLNSKASFKLNRPACLTSALFFDSEHIYITSAKIDQMCSRMRYSRPVILDALAEAGYSAGKTINLAAKLTRVTVKDAAGESKLLQVLKIPREVLEEFGEVSLLDGLEG